MRLVYRKKDYKARMFMVEFDGEDSPRSILVADVRLYDDMMENGEEQSDIDAGVYFYLDKDDMWKEAEEICKNCLDEEVKFIEEIL